MPLYFGYYQGADFHDELLNRRQPSRKRRHIKQKLMGSIVPSSTVMSQKRKENEKEETSSSDGKETSSSSDGEQKQDMVEEETRDQSPTPLDLQSTTIDQTEEKEASVEWESKSKLEWKVVEEIESPPTPLQSCATIGQKDKENEKVVELEMSLLHQPTTTDTVLLWDKGEQEEIKPTASCLVQSTGVGQKEKVKEKAPAEQKREEDLQFQLAILSQKVKKKERKKTPTKKKRDREKHTRSVEGPPLLITTKKNVVVAAEPYLYRAVTTGDIELLKQSLAKDVVELHAISSPQGNTVLHVASSFGHHEIVQIVYKRFPYLLMMTNSKGDTALHNAARDGHLMVVKFLIDCTKESVGGDVEKGNNRELLKMKNLGGNTALLECTKKGHQSVAHVLIEADGELPNLVNNSGESTFYLAAELGLYELVKQLLELPIDHSLPETKQHKTALHAAILQNHTSIIKILLEKKPELLHSRDSNGRSCLYYAAFLGCLEDVRCLLNTPNPHHGDPDGSFPIHGAAMKGHIHVIQEILARAPDSRELLDREGRNALHVAVLNNKENVVRFILETPELGKLINEVDLEGNTPLHLATIHSHPRIASILTRDRRVDIGIMNEKGQTAYEAGKLLALPSFNKVLTVGVLQSANASSLCRRQLSEENIDNKMLDEKTTRQSFKDGINTLVVVATLIVTLTFAAGLSMPGSFPNKGNPDMLTIAMRNVFVISNTIAMYSSIMATITLLWAHIGDLNQLNFALDWSMKFLALALTMVALAFAVGTNLMVSQLGWLPFAVLGLNLIFLPFILALLIPLLVPILPKNCWLQVLSNYSFQFLLFTSTYEVRQPLSE